MDKIEAREIHIVDINILNPAEYNPRKVTDKQWDEIRESITKFGIVDPLLVNGAENRKNILIGGHLRLKAAKDLGFTQIPIVYINISDIEREKELNIRLNKNLGEWDLDLLSNFSEEMLKDIGFESLELDKIFDEKKGEKNPDDAPEQRATTTTKQGDVFILGDHRLMCGSSTEEASAEKLMAGQRAEMVFTDPPYNVNYTGGMNENDKNSRDGIMNDNMSKGAFSEFLSKMCENIMRHCDGGVYICMSSSEIDTLKTAFEQNGGHWQSFIIWVKNHFTLSRSDYQHTYEPMLYGWASRVKNHDFIEERNIANVWEDLNKVKTVYEDGWTSIKFQGFEVRIEGEVTKGEVRRKKQRTNIWRYDKPTRSAEHPTMKPVAMVTEAVRNSSKREGIVLDLFGGSGSTMIACEILNRKCYMMELDPFYVDVIVRRWEEFTGQKAEKITA